MDEVSRAQDLIGNTVYDQAGSRIGRVDNVYVDDSTQQPEWVTVRSGFFGMQESFVPLAGATSQPGGLRVAVPKDKVKAAPHVETDRGHLSDEQGHDLYTHYGLRHATPGAPPEDGPAQIRPAQAIRKPHPAEDEDLREELIGRSRDDEA